jgi:hypothetical protein
MPNDNNYNLTPDIYSPPHNSPRLKTKRASQRLFLIEAFDAKGFGTRHFSLVVAPSVA